MNHKRSSARVCARAIRGSEQCNARNLGNYDHLKIDGTPSAPKRAHTSHTQVIRRAVIEPTLHSLLKHKSAHVPMSR
ncbi:hypothetical protein EVAR_60283_1 [Eumeta japonica]|uniref:Uncharacterized protein n=1 Tax=Eumeta variegata TaxID=151549 RepID=A0A4C1ZBZ7_EUMVA|nr:hypothetical protein EVAR_60283_1 [Eumeta japonica]